MARKTIRLRTKPTDAQRVRSRLLNEDVSRLTKQDIQILLKILDDVYPQRRVKKPVVLKAVCVGIVLGFWLCFLIALLF